MKYFLQYLLPGSILIAPAFFHGMQSNPLFGLIGFVAFFVVGITLIIEGWRKK